MTKTLDAGAVPKAGRDRFRQGIRDSHGCRKVTEKPGLPVLHRSAFPNPSYDRGELFHWAGIHT